MVEAPVHRKRRLVGVDKVHKKPLVPRGDPAVEREPLHLPVSRLRLNDLNRPVGDVPTLVHGSGNQVRNRVQNSKRLFKVRSLGQKGSEDALTTVHSA